MDPQGTRSIVDEAVEEVAGQSLFSAKDVPLARAEEILALVSGRAVREVLEARISHVVKHGHTPAGDASLPPSYLVHEARQDLGIAIDRINAGPDRRDIPRARARLVRGLAMGLAALDRLALEEREE